MNLKQMINEKIKIKDGKSLRQLFTNKNYTVRPQILSIINEIDSPIKDLLIIYNSSEYIQLIHSLSYFTLKNIWLFPLLKPIILKINRHAFLDNLENEFTKTLMNLYRENQKTFSQKDSLLIVDLLLNIYCKNKRNSLMDNLISVVEEPNLVCKESAIFYYFAGINYLANDNFKMGFLSLKKAIKYKFLREDAMLPYFIAAVLNNKCVEKSFLEKNQKFDFIKSVCNGVFDKTIIPIETLDKLNLLRCVNVHFPSVAIRNRIKMVYDAVCINFRLPVDCLKVVFKGEEVYCLVIRMISLGYLRGYLSLNRNVIVFSKLAPFPLIDE